MINTATTVITFLMVFLIQRLSRVYLGVHYPSDVAFGAFPGAAIAAALRTPVHGILSWLG